MRFDTEINQLMAQIDALKKENELLRASPQPSQELSKPVAIRYATGPEYHWEFTDHVKDFNFYPHAEYLYAHAPKSAQVILNLKAERDALKSEVERLINRLELSEYGYDGIHCRDVTIELLEIKIDGLEKENGELITNKAELLEALEKIFNDSITYVGMPSQALVSYTTLNKAKAIIAKMEGK